MSGTTEGAFKGNRTRKKMYTKKQIAEMNRKGGLVSKGGGQYFKWLKENDPDKLREIIRKREIKRKYKKL